MSDVAILHGNYFQRGGGELVADELAQTFDAPLFYGFGDDDAPPDDDVDRRKLFDPNSVNKRLVRSIPIWRDAMFAWYGTHRPELFDHDVVIQSYFQRGGGELVADELAQTFDAPLFYGFADDDAPPDDDVDSYGPDAAEQERPGTYLTFSRLYRHKRTREIVQAFADLDARLIVGGDGPQREHLADIATPNVDVRGYLSEPEKRRLLAECSGLIFNAENEDFGIVPVEAFASGTPVLGVRDGFTEYQVHDEKNGLLYPDGSAEAIADAVARHQSQPVAWSPRDIQAYAERYSLKRFREEMREIVNDAQQRGPADTPEVPLPNA